MLAMLLVGGCSGDDDSAASDASGDGWCALAQEIEDASTALDNSFDVGTDGAVALEAAYSEFALLLESAIDTAPDEITADVDTMARGVARFNELLEEADYDLAVLDATAFDEFESMSIELDAATEQIEAYNLSECGISPSSGGPQDSASSDEPPGVDDVVSTTAPATVDEATTDDDVTFVGDSDSDWCVAARQVEAASDDFEMIGFGDPEALEVGFGEMLGAFELALQFAPPELEADLEISFAAFQGADAALKAAEYDFLNADLSALDDVDGAVAAANDRIESYNEQVCGIVIDDDPAPDDTTLADEAGDGVAFDPAAGTLREQVIAEFVSQGFSVEESECLLDGIDFTDPALFNDVDALVAVFVECGVSLERLVAFGS